MEYDEGADNMIKEIVFINSYFPSKGEDNEHQIFGMVGERNSLHRFFKGFHCVANGQHVDCNTLHCDYFISRHILLDCNQQKKLIRLRMSSQ